MFLRGVTRKAPLTRPMTVLQIQQQFAEFRHFVKCMGESLTWHGIGCSMFHVHEVPVRVLNV